MESLSVINIISVPEGMENTAEEVRNEYVKYFEKKKGFVGSTFYRSIDRNDDKSIQYINIVTWQSRADYEAVVNEGFKNPDGENVDGMRVLGKGFPEPINVSPGRYIIVGSDGA